MNFKYPWNKAEADTVNGLIEQLRAVREPAKQQREQAGKLWAESRQTLVLAQETEKVNARDLAKITEALAIRRSAELIGDEAKVLDAKAEELDAKVPDELRAISGRMRAIAHGTYEYFRQKTEAQFMEIHGDAARASQEAKSLPALYGLAKWLQNHPGYSKDVGTFERTLAHELGNFARTGIPTNS